MKKRLSAGFTIVELLIAIVVIGILAAITIVAYNGLQDRAKQTTRINDFMAAKKGARSLQSQRSLKLARVNGGG